MGRDGYIKNTTYNYKTTYTQYTNIYKSVKFINKTSYETTIKVDDIISCDEIDIIDFIDQDISYVDNDTSIIDDYAIEFDTIDNIDQVDTDYIDEIIDCCTDTMSEYIPKN
jgi:hypothetical protein